MIDHISTSQTITEFLKKQGITIEVDEFAPVVGLWQKAGEESEYFVSQPRFTKGRCEFAFPYYGPGGEGNILKALRGLEKKTVAGSIEVKGSAWRNIYWHFNALHHTYGQGKTDGIALADLLYKIATEETNDG